jgi:predicted nucleic acid-binding protein
MRVMFDTNILVSAGLFGPSHPASLAEQISDEHILTVCGERYVTFACSRSGSLSTVN